MPELKWGEVIGPDDCPLMIRWLVQNRWGTIRIHHFLRSDEDQLHDHPWWFLTLVLKGGYLDETEFDGVKHYDRLKVGSVRFRPAQHRHRVVIEDSDSDSTVGSWSLVVTGPWQRHWGFWVGGVFVRWKSYFERYGYAACEPSTPPRGEDRG